MELINVNGVTIDKEVKTALDSFNVKIAQLQFGAQLTLKQNGGYMSAYDVAQELVNCVDLAGILDKSKKDLVAKAKQSKDEFLKIASDQSQFNTLENILNNVNRSYYSKGGQYAMLSIQPDSMHKHISSGTLYGIPNQTTLDPRRTGKIVVFDNLDNDLYSKMIYEAPKYGFVWYGPKDRNVWMYLGNVVKTMIVT